MEPVSLCHVMDYKIARRTSMDAINANAMPMALLDSAHSYFASNMKKQNVLRVLLVMSSMQMESAYQSHVVDTKIVQIIMMDAMTASV